MNQYSSYLITLRPLDAFFFGGEHNLDYGTKRQTVQRYYIASEDIPAQTTLLGTLRYAVLLACDALVTNPRDAEQRKKAADFVGSQSFSIHEARSFAKIGQLSPLFLLHSENATVHRLIPLPWNHTFTKEPQPYTPLHVIPCSQGVCCNQKKDWLYAENYNPKETMFGCWLSLADRTVFSQGDIFRKVVQVGINAHRTETAVDPDNSFFKKEKKLFRNSGDAFAFYAQLAPEVGDLLTAAVPVSMGQDQSPFLLQAVAEENHLIKEVKESLSKCYSGPAFYYALSDAFLCSIPSCFFIGGTKPFRYISTDLSKDTHRDRLSRTEELFRLYRAGSVFYCNEALEQPASCCSIGLNQFIKIGGVTI